MSDASHSDVSNSPAAAMLHRQDSSVSLGIPDSSGLHASPNTAGRSQPLMNVHQQYVCTVTPQCAKLTFARKCEWSKHMDRHDRPYRCRDPSCAKLQGFTYSGGLLRHEREVHNKHGGPKERLCCPYVDCKRHDGNGFTRKENLNEHIRRVHEKHKHEIAGAKADLDLLGATTSTSPNVHNRESISIKRRASEEADDLKRENKRLRSDNERLQARLVGLEEERRRSMIAPTSSVGFRHM